MRVYGMPTIWAESVEERVVSGVHAMVAKVKAPSRK
jgi:hypothetical protein